MSDPLSIILDSYNQSAIGDASGSDADVQQITRALLGTEASEEDSTSPKGAKGRYQIMPGTFKQYAMPGEKFDSEKDREKAAIRKINDDYSWAKSLTDDPQKIAGLTTAAYFSGRGGAMLWAQGRGHERNDGNLDINQYVDRAMGKLGSKVDSVVGSVDLQNGGPRLSAQERIPLPDGYETTGQRSWDGADTSQQPGFIDPSAPKETEGIWGAAKRGLAKTIPQTEQLLAGAGAAVADRLGANNVRDSLMGYYNRKEEEVGKQYSKDTDQFSNYLKTGDGLGNFIAHWTGYFTGQVAEAGVMAVAGGAIGSGAGGVGAIPGALTGLLAKTAVKAEIKQAAEKLLAKVAAEATAKGMTKEAADEAAKKAMDAFTKQAIAKAGGSELGQLAAMGTMGAGQEVGTIYGDVYNEAAKQGRKPTEEETSKAILYGLAAGGMEGLFDKIAIDKILSGSAKAPGLLNRAKGVASGVAQSELREVPTELAQTYLERAGAGKPTGLDNPDAANDYLETAASTAAGAWIPGIGGARVKNSPLTNASKAGGNVAATPSVPTAGIDQGPAATTPTPAQGTTPLGSHSPVAPGFAITPAGASASEGLGADLARVDAMLQSPDLIRAIRADKRFGPESVDDFLHAYNIARNPQVDINLRQEAMASIKSFLSGFSNQPNFTLGEGQPSTVTPPAVPGPKALPNRYDPTIIDGESRPAFDPMLPGRNVAGATWADSNPEMRDMAAGMESGQLLANPQVASPSPAQTEKPPVEVARPPMESVQPPVESAVRPKDKVQAKVEKEAPTKETKPTVQTQPASENQVPQQTAQVIDSSVDRIEQQKPEGAPESADDRSWVHDEIVNLIHKKGHTDNRRALDKLVDLMKRFMAGEEVKPGKIGSYLTSFKHEPHISGIIQRIYDRVKADSNKAAAEARRKTKEAKAAQAAQQEPAAPVSQPQSETEPTEASPEESPTQGEVEHEQAEQRQQDAEPGSATGAEGAANEVRYAEGESIATPRLAGPWTGAEILDGDVPRINEHEFIDRLFLRGEETLHVPGLNSMLKEREDRLGIAIPGMEIQPIPNTFSARVKYGDGSAYIAEFGAHKLDIDEVELTDEDEVSGVPPLALGTRGALRAFRVEGVDGLFDLVDAMEQAYAALAMQAERSPKAQQVDAEVVASGMTEVEPTEAQKKAGTYQKAHVSVQGMAITIETAKGQERSGISEDGTKWAVTMPAHYGYFKSTEGADGDHVDVFIGPNPESDKVWIINQRLPGSQVFDEHKVMLGYDSKESAIGDYLLSFSGDFGAQVSGPVAGPFSIDALKTLLPKLDRSQPVTDAGKFEAAPKKEPAAPVVASASAENLPAWAAKVAEKTGAKAIGMNRNGLVIFQRPDGSRFAQETQRKKPVEPGFGGKVMMPWNELVWGAEFSLPEELKAKDDRLNAEYAPPFRSGDRVTYTYIGNGKKVGATVIDGPKASHSVTYVLFGGKNYSTLNVNFTYTIATDDGKTIDYAYGKELVAGEPAPAPEVRNPKTADEFFGDVDAGYKAHFDYSGADGVTVWIEKVEGKGWVMKTQEDGSNTVFTKGGAGLSVWDKMDAMKAVEELGKYRFTEWKQLVPGDTTQAPKASDEVTSETARRVEFKLANGATAKVIEHTEHGRFTVMVNGESYGTFSMDDAGNLSGFKARANWAMDYLRSSAEQLVARYSNQAPSSGYTIKPFKHTKTGETLFAVNLDKHTDRETYQRINRMAVKYGGKWSNFNGGGAIKGFLFKSEENAKAWIAEIAPIVGLDNSTGMVNTQSKETTNHERSSTSSEGTEALGAVAAEQNQGTEGRGDVRGDDAEGGRDGAGYDKQPDAAGLQGVGSRGSGPEGLHSAEAGSGSERAGMDEGRTGAEGSPVSEGSGRVEKDDLGALFDEVLAEETGAKPKKERAPRSASTKAKDTSKPTSPRKPRSAGSAAASAAKNTAAGFSDAIAGLGKLFGGPGKLNSGFSFDEETYAKAKPLFQSAIAHLGEAAKDLKEAMRAVVRAVLEQFGAKAAENVKPYVVRFMEDVRDGKVTATGEPVAPNVAASNFKITDAVRLGQGSEAVKFADNLNAIRTLKAIESENRRATPEEQQALARYVGWGGLKNYFADQQGNFKEGFEAKGKELASLLTPRELAAARSSTRNAHYTSETVVRAMWDAAHRLGFRGGIALEPSMGTGNFIGMIPDSLAATKFIGVEYDSLTSRIARALYPQATVLHSPFQKVPLPDGSVDIAIGNPPFGSESLYFQFKTELNGQSIHNQFFNASMDAVKPGGLQVMVVSRYLLDSKDATARRMLAGKARLLGAIRLPDTAFKENARTEVVTDILFLQRLSPAEEATAKAAMGAANSRPKGGETYQQRQEREALASQVPEWIETKEVRDPLGSEPMTVNAYFSSHPEMIVGRLERSGTMQNPEYDAQGNRIKGINVRLENGADFNAMLREAVAKLPSGVVNTSHDAIAASVERYKTMAESLEIAISGAEEGHIEFNADGQLTEVTERETPEGGYELNRRVLTAESPWSSSLNMDKDGNWYRLVVKTNEKGENVKEGRSNVYVRDVFKSEADIPATMRLGETKLAKLKDLVKLRDLFKKQIVLESSDAPKADMEVNRKALAAQYDAFVKENGFVSEPKNAGLISEMPDGALVLSLELSYRPEITKAKASKTGERPRKASVTTAPILKERAVFPYAPPGRAETATDALVISLSETGRVDIPRIAELLGMDEDQAIEAVTGGSDPLVFKDPETNTYQTRDQYLSGQVRRKLEAARAAGMSKNVEALEKVQPEPWGSDVVTAHLGAAWIPGDVYASFVTHLTGEPAMVSYAPITNSFSVSGKAESAKANEWAATGSSGRITASPVTLISDKLNSRTTQIRYKDAEGNVKVDPTDTALAALKAKAIEIEFSDWVFADSARRQRLTDIFNEKFNTRAMRQHDGSHLILPGKVPDQVISMRRHQKNAIWRGIAERFMLVDHVVGAGKTFTAIARVMERRRMGLSRKPMIVVPNHLVEEWAVNVYRLYPGAKVLAAGKADMEKSKRRRLFAKIASGDWDVVIVPHSSFGFIDISPETEERFLEAELALAEQAIKDAQEQAEEDGHAGGRFKPFNVAEAERLREGIQKRMDSLKARKKDRLLTFEQMGVDDLTVDEAHEFKNLFYSSRLSGVRGMGNKTGSQKAFDLYNKVRVLRESPSGTVTFMTGTPISNSAVEMYTMMRYLAADELKDLGLENFDAWRAQFVDVDMKFEPTESGGLKEVNRMGRSWSNMRSLMELYYSFTDAVTIDDIKKWYAEDNAGAQFPVPKVKGGERTKIVIKPTEAQKDFLENVVIRGFDSLDGISDVKERNKERLRLMDKARKVATDIRAADPHNTSDEKGGKLDRVAEEAVRIYKKWDADKGTQLIFLDRSVPKSKGDDAIIKRYDELVARRTKAIMDGDEAALRDVTDKLDEFDSNEIETLRNAQTGGWNAYQQIKDNLIARGIPAEEIRFVQEANTDAQKQALFDAVNDGSVRILLGSTPRMGAGTNVQQRLVALHHVDVTWKPSDIEQREGRIIRQGNKLLAKYGDDFEIEIPTYATERTMDAKMWDLNATKLRTINGIRNYNGEFNMEFEDEEAVGMAEMAALASGDPLLLERVKLMSEIDRLEMVERAHRRKMFGIKDQIEKAERDIATMPGNIESSKAKAAKFKAALDALAEEANGRKVTVEGEDYTSMIDANAAAEAAIAEQRGGDEKARFAISINGKKVTSKDAVAEAIHDALGDNSPFLATIGKNTYNRRGKAAKDIAAQASDAAGNLGNGEAVTLDLGNMLGLKLEADVSSSQFAKDAFDIALSLTDEKGKTLASVQGDRNDGGKFSQQYVRKLIEHLEGTAESYARGGDADYYERRLKQAKEDLPSLKEQDGKPFPQADELKAKNERLNEVVRLLSSGKTEEKKGDDSGEGAPMESRSGSELYEGAAAIRSMSEDERDNLDPANAPGGWGAYNLYEAQKLLPSPSDKLKRVTERNSLTLWQDYDYIANVDGSLYGVSKYEDPDNTGEDEDESFVFAFSRLDDPNRNAKETTTADVGELFDEIRKDKKLESRGEAPRLTGATVSDIRSALAKAFGEKSIRNLEANGRAKVVESAEAFMALIPGVEVSPSAKAVFVNGQAFFFANRMIPDTAHREMLHEIGEHYGLEKMLGIDGYDSLIQQVKEMKDGDGHVKAAWAFVKERYPSEAEGSKRFMHEVLAQIGQNADIQARPLWKQVIEAVKRFLVKMGFTGFIKISDIQDMVLHSLKVAAAPGGDGGPRGFSHPSVEFGNIQESQSSPVFYSQLYRAISMAPEKINNGPAPQWKTWLISNAGKLGVKKEEIQWTGITDWLDAQGKRKVSKDEIASYLEQGGVKVQEVELGGRSESIKTLAGWKSEFKDDTKYRAYQLPGGSNYRELLLTLPARKGQAATDGAMYAADQSRSIIEALPRESIPSVAQGMAEQYGFEVEDMENAIHAVRANKNLSGKTDFISPHFQNATNIISHVRFNERTDAEGRRVLFLEEVQSDWGQKGKKHGFKPKEFDLMRMSDGVWRTTKPVPGVGDYVISRASTLEAARQDVSNQLQSYGEGDIPLAPFVTDTKSWTSLTLKRMLRYAVDNGFDAIAWTTGEQQSGRYDLSKQVDRIAVGRYNDGYQIIARKNGDVLIDRVVRDARELAEVVGKDIADKVVSEKQMVFEGLDLKIGGEGMKGYYDAIVPQVMRDVLKQVGGGEVVGIDIPMAQEDSGGYTVVDVSGNEHNFSARWKAEKFFEENEGSYFKRHSQPGIILTDAMKAKASDGLPLFAKSALSSDRIGFAHVALQELAFEDEAFRYPVSRAGTLQSVMRDVFPGVQYVVESTREDEKQESGADHRYTFLTPDTPAKDGNPERRGKQFDVFVTRDKVWIDVHRFQPGDQGSRVYAAVANFAYNTRRVFTGDPAGVSADAVVARTKMMLSSALRFGTTRHLEASREQEKGIPDEGIPPLDWRGNDVEKIRALVHTFVMTAEKLEPSIKDYSYDFEKRTFVRNSDSKPAPVLQGVGGSQLEPGNDGRGNSARTGAPRIGKDSGRAAIVIRSLIRGESSKIGDGGILQTILDQSGALVSNDGGLRGMFSEGNYLDGFQDIPGRIKPTWDSTLNKAVSALKGSDKFGWMDKTIHTQLHKAQKNPYFGEVFKRLQHFMADSSRAALRPAELAPTVLPRIDVVESLPTALKAFLKGKEASADIDAAFQVVLNGTLEDRVFKTAEDASLTPEQFRIYREFRDSIDASLEELSASEAWGVARQLFTLDGRLLPDGLDMKKAILENPTEARNTLSGTIEAMIESAKIRANALLDLAREAAPFMGKTADPIEDLKKALQSDRGNQVQNQAIAKALDAFNNIKPLEDVLAKVTEIFNRRDELQRNGYAPLMRFGQHYLTVLRIDPMTGERMLNEDGEPETEFFGLYESESERDAAMKALQEEYGDNEFIQFDSGTMSEEEWRLYKGVSPESVALFAGKLGISNDEVFQEWYRKAASNRSTLKRLIKRKGTAGFSTDGSRSLASFLTSNGRRASSVYHAADVAEAIEQFPRQQGAEKDEAIKLSEYVQHPEEEASGARSLMFMHFLGGSISNFFINATQPWMVTLPYLSKFVGMPRAMALMKDAYKNHRNNDGLPQEIKDALDKAEQEGVVGASEIHHLWQETARPVLSHLTKYGDAISYRANAFMQLWGMPFAFAEHMNRRTTFIAAYNAAKEIGDSPEQAYSKAIMAVNETQFVYGKQNRPDWARGSIGALVFTFKLFSISYTELLVRMLRESKESRKAALYMLGILAMASGTQGLPGGDDMDDLIDTICQMLGYNVSIKQSKRKWLEDAAGKEFAQVVMYGLSSLTPLDVQARMGLGNLIPATGLLKPSNDKKSADILELVGPIGGLAQSYINTADAVSTGNWSRASTEWMPKAFKDATKGVQMAVTGEYRDTKGRKVQDVDGFDAFLKGVGFQPQNVATESRNMRDTQQLIDYAKRKESLIVEKWAQGVHEKDPQAIADAKDDLAQWNADNPRTPIGIKVSQVQRRVKEMNATKHDRFLKSATKEMRETVMEDLE